MTLQELLANPPLLHYDMHGNQVSWQLSEAVLHFIDEHVGEGSRTLETGEGLSTILFAMKGCIHRAVTPNDDAIGKMRKFAAEHGISLDRVTFEVGPSDKLLPTMKLGELDLVLIDGGHGFPVPFIDWYYTAAALKPRGIVIVDDTQIWTGAVLRDFLMADPDWKLAHLWEGRAAAFTKLTDTSPAKEWVFQPFVRDWTVPEPTSPDRQPRSRELEQAEQIARGLEFLRRGQLVTFTKKLVKNIFSGTAMRER